MYNADSDILNFLDRGPIEESGNHNKETRLYGSVVSPGERSVAELYIIQRFCVIEVLSIKYCDKGIKQNYFLC